MQSSMTAGAPTFFRKRAQSFSNAASAPNSNTATIAGLPVPDENAVDMGEEGASAPDILFSQANSTSTIIPSAPILKTSSTI